MVIVFLLFNTSFTLTQAAEKYKEKAGEK